jgi:hypothetical protein
MDKGWTRGPGQERDPIRRPGLTSNFLERTTGLEPATLTLAR